MDDKQTTKTSIFDDVFMTMFERMPKLFIPLINEAFGTDYSDDEEIIKLRDEHHFPENRIITDSFMGIRDARYHFECQSKDDSCMIIRMFEYDTAIALESMESAEDGVTEIRYPRSCVIYLRGKNCESRKEVLRVRFPDESVYSYSPEILEVSEYSLDELFKKKLLIFLPFYLLRYEKTIKKDDTESVEFQKLMEETKELIERLDSLYEILETDLIDLIKRITDYICRASKNSKERMDGVMRGRVLELRSDVLKAEGRAEGRAEGETKVLAELVQDGIIDTKTAAKKLGVSVKKFKELAAAQSFVL